MKPQIAKRLVRVLEGNYGDHKKLNNELYELRFKIGSGYRIYYSEYKNIIVVLLCAGDKSTQTKDIKKAKRILDEIKE